MTPSLSVVVITYNMRREAARTLYTLSRRYQRGIEDLDYEVLVVDNGSSEPLDEAMVTAHGPEFRYQRRETAPVSPVPAVNAAVRDTRGEFVAICIDGARMVSPGLLRFLAMGCRLAPRPVVATLAWHLGPKLQNLSMLEGYDQAVEDRLLAECGWQEDGYRLFGVSCLAGSSAKGWFLPISESNFMAMPRALFETLGGLDEGFATAGGGYANLDFYKRACELPGTELVLLLGEGSFHQYHGGVAANARPDQHPRAAYVQEYRALRGEDFSYPQRPALYLGTVPPAMLPHLRHSLDAIPA